MDDRKRVVEFLSYGGIGGTQRLVLEFLRRASHEKFHFYVCVLLEHNWVNDEAANLHIENISLNMGGYADIGAWARLYRWLQGKNVDLIRTYGLKAHLIGRIVGKMADIPANITTVHSIDPWRRWHHVALDCATAGLCDLYLANSEAGRQMTHARERIPLARIATVPNGIDVERFSCTVDQDVREAYRQQFGLTNDDLVIGMIANFRKMKGHATLVEAFPHILSRVPQAKCLFIGEAFVNEPDYHQQLVQSIQAQGLHDHIRFTGPRNDMPEMLAITDIVTLPTWWEGLPVSLTEAMAMGKPVVASSVGGIPEIIDDHVTGVLIPPRDATALAEALLELLTSPDMAKRLGQAGQARVRKEFSLERMVADTERTYEQVIAQKSRGRK